MSAERCVVSRNLSRHRKIFNIRKMNIHRIYILLFQIDFDANIARI